VRTDPYTIFIIDDQPVFVTGLTVILEKDSEFKVRGSADCWEALPEDLKSEPPDLFIVEIFLRNSDGFKLLTLLRRYFPSSAILVYSVQEEALCGERALQSGAKGYLMKSDNLEIIHQAIRKLANGNVYLSSRLQEMIFSRISSKSSSTDPVMLRELTNRELQIMQFIGSGRSTAEIAAAMNLRVKTVEAHRSRIKKKLKLKHTTELIQYAVYWTGLGSSLPRARSF